MQELALAEEATVARGIDAEFANTKKRTDRLNRLLEQSST
jgi:hypothetical protein